MRRESSYLSLEKNHVKNFHHGAYNCLRVDYAELPNNYFLHQEFQRNNLLYYINQRMRPKFLRQLQLC